MIQGTFSAYDYKLLFREKFSEIDANYNIVVRSFNTKYNDSYLY